MKRTKKEYKDILNETLDFYQYDTTKRAVENQACLYHIEDGRMCAIGRCLINAKSFNKRVQTKEPTNSGIFGLYKSGFHIEKSLKKEYRGFELDFWERLQDFHDHDKFWNEKRGMTDKGKEEYKSINVWIDLWVKN